MSSKRMEIVPIILRRRLVQGLSSNQEIGKNIQNDEDSVNE